MTLTRPTHRTPAPAPLRIDLADLTADERAVVIALDSEIRRTGDDLFRCGYIKNNVLGWQAWPADWRAALRGLVRRHAITVVGDLHKGEVGLARRDYYLTVGNTRFVPADQDAHPTTIAQQVELIERAAEDDDLDETIALLEAGQQSADPYDEAFTDWAAQHGEGTGAVDTSPAADGDYVHADTYVTKDTLRADNAALRTQVAALLADYKALSDTYVAADREAEQHARAQAEKIRHLEDCLEAAQDAAVTTFETEQERRAQAVKLAADSLAGTGPLFGGSKRAVFAGEITTLAEFIVNGGALTVWGGEHDGATLAESFLGSHDCDSPFEADQHG